MAEMVRGEGENFLARAKDYRGIPTHSNKTASGYAANWNLVAPRLASR